MTFNDRTTPLSLLATRRSAKARDLVAPGPDEAELRQMLEIATRTPDHGKLAPWRFVVVPQDARDALAAALVEAYRAEKPGAGRMELDTMDQFSRYAPTLVVVLASPKLASKIPLWEQELSVGAATMNLEHAAHAMGYAACWLTGWAAFSDAVRDLFGAASERIAGFVFIGTPSRELEERPRPDLDRVVSTWTGAV
ncbi:nitroreductase family protein [Sphingomonas turrisvirgatae]|uniref:Putative NAD(P)H nitroreductase n=1 Tax=Sphingomonas turrisvirgatae TaxID=1888892 RepID=A0A1E3LY86_9SPHN|nr:nitroreductase [Sphingomonas turrisvirgatae]ODP38674.1 nitroreductase [Sphingomonas turrisvirgatae]